MLVEFMFHVLQIQMVDRCLTVAFFKPVCVLMIFPLINALKDQVHPSQKGNCTVHQIMHFRSDSKL